MFSYLYNNQGLSPRSDNDDDDESVGVASEVSGHGSQQGSCNSDPGSESDADTESPNSRLAASPYATKDIPQWENKGGNLRATGLAREGLAEKPGLGLAREKMSSLSRGLESGLLVEEEIIEEYDVDAGEVEEEIYDEHTEVPVDEDDIYDVGAFDDVYIEEVDVSEVIGGLGAAQVDASESEFYEETETEAYDEEIILSPVDEEEVIEETIREETETEAEEEIIEVIMFDPSGLADTSARALNTMRQTGSSQGLTVDALATELEVVHIEEVVEVVEVEEAETIVDKGSPDNEAEDAGDATDSLNGEECNREDVTEAITYIMKQEQAVRKQILSQEQADDLMKLPLKELVEILEHFEVADNSSTPIRWDLVMEKIDRFDEPGVANDSQHGSSPSEDEDESEVILEDFLDEEVVGEEMLQVIHETPSEEDEAIDEIVQEEQVDVGEMHRLTCEGATEEEELQEEVILEEEEILLDENEEAEVHESEDEKDEEILEEESVKDEGSCSDSSNGPNLHYDLVVEGQGYSFGADNAGCGSSLTSFDPSVWDESYGEEAAMQMSGLTVGSKEFMLQRQGSKRKPRSSTHGSLSSCQGLLGQSGSLGSSEDEPDFA